jgi:hypothetical protein
LNLYLEVLNLFVGVLNIFVEALRCSGFESLRGSDWRILNYFLPVLNWFWCEKGLQSRLFL